MSFLTQFTGGSSESTSVGGYALFSSDSPNLITLPDGKVFLKSGVITPAFNFPTIPGERTAYMNPVVPVANIGSGGRYESIIIDPLTGFPIILGDQTTPSIIYMYGANTSNALDCVEKVASTGGSTGLRIGGITYSTALNCLAFTTDSSRGAGGVRSVYLQSRFSNTNYGMLATSSTITSFSGSSLATTPVKAIAASPTGNIVAIDARTFGNVAVHINALNTSVGNSSTLPSSGEWPSIAWGSNLFVTVRSGSNAGAVSANGVVWGNVTLPSTANWRSVSSNDNVFLAMATGSANAAVSTDGITWNSRTMPAVADWAAAAYSSNLNLWCAVAKESNIAATSTDTVTWTQRTLPVVADWQDIKWSPALGLFVTVADDGRAAAATSPDGITWNSKPLPSHILFNYITSDGNTRFWAQEDNSKSAAGQQTIAYSADTGQTWRYFRPNVNTGYSSSPSELRLRYVNGNIFLGSRDNSSDSASFYRSTDGNIWLKSNIAISSTITFPTDIAYNGNVIVALIRDQQNQNNTNIYATSTDGVTWTQRTLPQEAVYTHIVAMGNVFVVAGTVDSSYPTAGTRLYRSANGITWTNVGAPGAPTGNVLAGSSGFTYNTTQLRYNPITGVGSYNNNLITYDRGATWTTTARTGTNPDLMIPGGGNTWVGYYNTSAATTSGKDSLNSTKSVNLGYSLNINGNKYTPLAGSGGTPQPLYHGNTVYFLGSSSALVTPDANLYIDNVRPGSEGAALAQSTDSLMYYMRVK